jgi:hypothetical protein
MPIGGWRGFEKVSCDIFPKFEPYFCLFACFFEGKNLVFWKIKMSVSPNDTWGRLKIGQILLHII